MLPLAKPDIARTLFALRSIARACFSRIFCAVFRCFLFCLLVLFSSASSSSELFFFGFFSSESSSFCFRPRRLSFERNPFISSRARKREETFTSSSLKRRLAMMIFLALYSRAQLLLIVREKARRKTAPLFSKRSQTSFAFVVWREDRETFPENDAFRMKDTHARNYNNNTKQIPDKIPTAGKNV